MSTDPIFNTMDRRTFMKIMGLTGGSLALNLTGCGNASIETGAEEVNSYVDPEEFAIPGDEVWYASTCRQCPAGCGIHARLREGRVRKLEGNPHSPVNIGRLCMMGQAGLQAHYHPDRLQQPLLRQNGELQAVSWQQAGEKLADIITKKQADNGSGFGLLSGQVSGHLAVLMDALMEPLNLGKRFIYEPLSTATSRAVHQQTLGLNQPVLQLNKAQLVVSFGADFLGPWQSPVHYAAQYGQLREAPRGSLIQVESKMSLTGANADWWLAVKPGTEAWLMLGVAKILSADKTRTDRLSADVLASLDVFDLATVSRHTTVSEQHIQRLASALDSYQPSLIIAGGQAEASSQGSASIAAAVLLNHMLGNFGKTLSGADHASMRQLDTRPASTASIIQLAEALPSLDTLFIIDSNPLYSAPVFLELKQQLAQLKNKVVFSTSANETTAIADLVIPVRSALEDWGTHLPAHASEKTVLQIQQPVMSPLYKDLPGMGDQLLALLKQLDPEVYAQWPNFYSYLRHSLQLMRPAAQQATNEKLVQLPAMMTPPAMNPDSPEQLLPEDEIDRLFWETTLARGVLPLPGQRQKLQINLKPIKPAAPENNTEFPFHLLPTPRLGLYDGRHADLPWLQELPDQLSTVVWDSWAEIHPDTAARLQITEGDVVNVESAQGSLQVKVILFAGMHSDAVAVPLGQGHTVGRYAKDVGVNPFAILSPQYDDSSGELAMYSTRVKILKTSKNEMVVKLAPTDSQHKRRLVRTVSSAQLKPKGG